MSNYTVIARRWRPKRFDDVIGQPHVVTTLKNSIKFDRIAHAYLFTGPRGVGKTTVARILAKAVNCTNRSGDEPCGSCDNCKAIDSGNFVDIVEIDAASTRKIEDIRELRETVKYMPMKGMYKTYILDEAHQLTGDAKDAFLKTLEEPPGHNIFILATTEIQKIPYTIMSRCQRFDFRRITETEIATQLKRICDDEAIGYEEGVFQYVAAEADGSMRDSQSILDQIIAYSGSHISLADVVNVIGIVEKDILYGIVRSALTGDLREGLRLIEETLDRGYDIHQVYKGLVTILRNMLVIKVCDGVPDFLYMSEEEHRRNLDLLKDIEYYELQNMLHYLLKAEDLMRGLFPKISLELLFINLHNLSRLRDVEKAIDALRGQGLPEAQVRPADFEAPAAAEPVLPAPKAADRAPARDRTERRPDKPEPPVQEETFTHAGQGEPGGYAPDRDAGVFRDKEGFLESLRKGSPMIGYILSSLETRTEGDNFIVMLDSKQVRSGVKGVTDQKDDIKAHLKGFFGREMGLEFRDTGEVKRSILDEYVKEAETLFKI